MIRQATCAACGFLENCDFKVMDDAWKTIVPIEYRKQIVCVKCFEAFASAKQIELIRCSRRQQGISQARNLGVGLCDKGEFGLSPDAMVCESRRFSNVLGLKRPFVFVPNRLQKNLAVGAVGRRAGKLTAPHRWPIDRRTWIKTPSSSRRGRGG